MLLPILTINKDYDLIRKPMGEFYLSLTGEKYIKKNSPSQASFQIFINQKHKLSYENSIVAGTRIELVTSGL